MMSISINTFLNLGLLQKEFIKFPFN